jgi:hypothetical protein
MHSSAPAERAVPLGEHPRRDPQAQDVEDRRRDRPRSHEARSALALDPAYAASRRTGAIVKAYGEPIRTRSYRKWFREIAQAAKIPDSVWNMDARAGAVTEALEAGAEERTVQRAATHASPAITRRYDRTAETAPLAVAEARRKARQRE